jgi:hypothetical protein
MSYGPTVSLEKGLGRGGWYAVFFLKNILILNFQEKNMFASKIKTNNLSKRVMKIK